MGRAHSAARTCSRGRTSVRHRLERALAIHQRVRWRTACTRLPAPALRGSRPAQGRRAAGASGQTCPLRAPVGSASRTGMRSTAAARRAGRTDAPAGGRGASPAAENRADSCGGLCHLVAGARCVEAITPAREDQAQQQSAGVPRSPATPVRPKAPREKPCPQADPARPRKRIARVETTRDLRSRFTLIPVSSSSPGCSFLPLHAPGARWLERTSEQNPSFGDRGGSHGPAARPVVSTSRLV